MGRKYRIIARFAIVLSVPILIAVILYPPWETEIFASKDYSLAKFKIENLFLRKPGFQTLAADVFSISSLLDWYKVKITNKSELRDPDCVAQDPSTIFITFYKGDPKIYYTNLKEATEQTGGYGYYLKTGESAFFIAPSWEDYSLDGGLMFSGDCKLRLGSEFKMSEPSFDLAITMRPYWKAWIIRLVVLYILWFVLLSSFISIWQWLSPKHKSAL